MTLAERDKNVIWHPYTQMKTADAPIAIVKGEGALVFDENGKQYIDAVSSWWVNLHGHSHPYIAQKVSEQLHKLEHIIFAGFTHEGAVELAERLLKILPSNQSRVFYSDNGSTAVEVALKMTFQYWYNKGHKSKSKFVAFEHAYHGDTFGSMSVSGKGAFTQPFEKLCFDVIRIPVPLDGYEAQSIGALQEAIDSAEIAGFIFEPLVMGAGGMLMYTAKALDQLIGICKENDIITIADEVLTGFGRTGKLFASGYLHQQPDILCLSKGITGGFLPLGLTSCSQEIYNAFLSDDQFKTFFHGHSYTANPLACAAALASLDLLMEEDCRNKIEEIHQRHLAFAVRMHHHPALTNVRVTGTFLAMEMHSKNNTSYFNPVRDSLYRFFLNRGIILRPLGNVIYFLPPYCIRNSEIDLVYRAMEELADTDA